MLSGVAPNFVSDDVFSFIVKQPNSPFNVLTAHNESWQWDINDPLPTLVLTFDDPVTIGCVGILRHEISQAVISLYDSANALIASITISSFYPNSNTLIIYLLFLMSGLLIYL